MWPTPPIKVDLRQVLLASAALPDTPPWPGRWSLTKGPLTEHPQQLRPGHRGIRKSNDPTEGITETQDTERDQTNSGGSPPPYQGYEDRARQQGVIARLLPDSPSDEEP